MRNVWLLTILILAGGCVSRGAYQKQQKALSESLVLTAKAIGQVRRLEEENAKFRKVYGDAVRINDEAEARMKAGQLK